MVYRFFSAVILIAAICSTLYSSASSSSAAAVSGNAAAPSAPGILNVYQALVEKTINNNWKEVRTLLKNNEAQLLAQYGEETNQRNVLCAIARSLVRALSGHPSSSSDYSPMFMPEATEATEVDDLQTINQAFIRINLTKKKQTPENVEQKLENYLNTTKILNIFGGDYAKARNVLKQALTIQIKKSGNKWPGSENLQKQEQFFWNMRSKERPQRLSQIFSCKPFPTGPLGEEFKNFYLLYLRNEQEVRDNPGIALDLLTIFEAFPTEAERASFIKFYKSYEYGNFNILTPVNMIKLLPIFQAFPTAELHEPFQNFCRNIINWIGGYHPLITTSDAETLFPIFQAFPSDEQFFDFRTFCVPYIAMKELALDTMNNLFPIFHAFPTEESRAPFLEFCKPHFVGLEKYPLSRQTVMTKLFPIFQSFSTAEDQALFLEFCNPYLEKGYDSQKIENMTALLSVFQAFPTAESRALFLKFCEPLCSDDDISIMATVLPVYLHQLEDFKAFNNQHVNFTMQKRWKRASHCSEQIPDINHKEFFESYNNQTYLRYMRVLAALHAEPNSTFYTTANRVEIMYQTPENQPLPVLWPDDPFIQQAQLAAGVANVHDFDPIYEQDFNTLKDWCTQQGYMPAASTTARTIYNGTIQIPNYHTNVEVEDFITYLDTTIANGPVLKLDGKDIEPARIVSLIKQMLGLEQKTGGTSGGFAPYLGHSMFFARPDSPKGDEVLGRVWFMMKKAGEGKSPQDAEDYKKSVVLAILEAAELSATGAETHCQTRMTGELMKAIIHVLPSSKLRSRLIYEEPAAATNDQAIVDRITNAPMRGLQIFDRIHREDTGEVRKLREPHVAQGTDPELWELYQAYYDDLYQRTKNPDGTYRPDANTLTRDDHGNLVKAHLDDGSQRPAADVQKIVYHQAEFQVLEGAFTECMRKEFEEHRGIKY